MMVMLIVIVNCDQENGFGSDHDDDEANDDCENDDWKAFNEHGA